MNILLVITGSISCKLFWKLQEKFEKNNNVKVIFTDVAAKIAEKELEYFFMEHEKAIYTHGNNPKYSKLSGNGYKYCCDINGKYHKYSCSFPVYYYVSEKLMCNGGLEHELDVYEETGKVEHIELCNWADKMVIAPCTANTLNKIRYGIADNFVMTTILAFLGTYKPTYIAPAMNYNMWNNFNVKSSIDELNQYTYINFLYPTVKKLACGDFGIGALANIDDIYNIVNNEHEWYFPIKDLSCLINYDVFDESIRDYLPRYNEPGSFGAIRKHDIHTGVDIYVKENTLVYPVENGEVIDIRKFTGKEAGSEWWNETWVVSIKGKSGIVSYGEIQPNQNINIGDKLSINDIIGKVIAVLPKEKTRKDIRNHNNAMLHLELYKNLEDGIAVVWNLNEDRPKNLLDPTIYLYNIGEGL